MQQSISKVKRKPVKRIRNLVLNYKRIYSSEYITEKKKMPGCLAKMLKNSKFIFRAMSCSMNFKLNLILQNKFLCELGISSGK